jgi:amino acid transporter
MSLMERVLGRTLASHEEEGRKIGPLAGVPMLGLDALASAAYGPEATLTLLLPLGALGLTYIGPITLVILALLAILYFSYRQTTAAYPNGGGSYTVARANLGTRAGLLAAASLLLDYVLNVAVGIAAGVGALVSAVPALHGHILGLCLLVLALVAFVNLRGIHESGTAFILPTYLFVGCLGLTLVFGLVKTALAGGHPLPVEAPPAVPIATAGVSLWLLMRAFANGCTAMTGVEAISNGISAFAKPAVTNAQRTLTLVVAILGVLLGGIAFLCRAYHIAATDPSSAQYQSVLSLLVAAVMGRGPFYYVTLAAVLSVLALSANTSFADFPRLCRLIAEDDCLPHAFANRGRRLVYTLGIVSLTTLSAGLLIAFGGITDRLIPLFAIGAFGAFTLSQAGMVVHWRRTAAAGDTGARASLLVNGLGAVATALALAVVLATKFLDGAWVTLLLIGALLVLFDLVRLHYAHVTQETEDAGPLDTRPSQPPLVVVPVKGWTTITERALRFSLDLSPDVVALHISTDERDAAALRTRWEECVERPFQAAGLPGPRLTILASPYRRLFTPLLDYVRELRASSPDRTLAVVIPELVEAHWYQYLLHNQRATGLKAALLLRGHSRVVVVNVPWYLSGGGARP